MISNIDVLSLNPDRHKKIKIKLQYTRIPCLHRRELHISESVIKELATFFYLLKLLGKLIGT
jgi:hypothetical protein